MKGRKLSGPARPDDLGRSDGLCLQHRPDRIDGLTLLHQTICHAGLRDLAFADVYYDRTLRGKATTASTVRKNSGRLESSWGRGVLLRSTLLLTDQAWLLNQAAG